MPRKTIPKIGKGLVPANTVADNSLRYPERDADPLRVHIHDPSRAHMASSIGIVDAGNCYASDEVEGALQELCGIPGALSGMRLNGLIEGGTYSGTYPNITLVTPTSAHINGTFEDLSGLTFDFSTGVDPVGGGATSVAQGYYLYVETNPASANYKQLQASTTIPPVENEMVLIAYIVHDGANYTNQQDARFFVRDLDRKVQYTTRNGENANAWSEGCFATLEAAFFWLSKYHDRGAGLDDEFRATLLVRGNHTITRTLSFNMGPTVTGVYALKIQGDGANSIRTGVGGFSGNEMLNLNLASNMTTDPSVGIVFEDLVIQNEGNQTLSNGVVSVSGIDLRVTINNCTIDGKEGANSIFKGDADYSVNDSVFFGKTMFLGGEASVRAKGCLFEGVSSNPANQQDGFGNSTTPVASLELLGCSIAKFLNCINSAGRSGIDSVKITSCNFEEIETLFTGNFAASTQNTVAPLIFIGNTIELGNATYNNSDVLFNDIGSVSTIIFQGNTVKRVDNAAVANRGFCNLEFGYDFLNITDNEFIGIRRFNLASTAITDSKKFICANNLMGEGEIRLNNVEVVDIINNTFEISGASSPLEKIRVLSNVLGTASGGTHAIRNNSFDSTSGEYVIRYDAESFAGELSISGNNIKGGAAAIYLVGNAVATVDPNIAITNNNISGASGDGILRNTTPLISITQCGRNPILIDQNTLSYACMGVYLYDTTAIRDFKQVIISNNDIQNIGKHTSSSISYAAGITVYKGGSSDAIRGLDIHNNKIGNFASLSNQPTILNEQAELYGIRVSPYGLTTNCSGVSIKDNHIYQLGYKSPLSAVGAKVSYIEVNFGAESGSNTIEDNYLEVASYDNDFSQVPLYGIKVDSTDHIYDLSIRGNKIVKSGQTDATGLEFGNGIVVLNGRGEIVGTATGGTVLGGIIEHLVVEGNEVVGAQMEAIVLSRPAISDSSTKTLIYRDIYFLDNIIEVKNETGGDLRSAGGAISILARAAYNDSFRVDKLHASGNQISCGNHGIALVLSNTSTNRKGQITGVFITDNYIEHVDISSGSVLTGNHNGIKVAMNALSTRASAWSTDLFDTIDISRNIITSELAQYTQNGIYIQNQSVYKAIDIEKVSVNDNFLCGDMVNGIYFLLQGDPTTELDDPIVAIKSMVSGNRIYAATYATEVMSLDYKTGIYFENELGYFEDLTISNNEVYVGQNKSGITQKYAGLPIRIYSKGPRELDIRSEDIKITDNKLFGIDHPDLTEKARNEFFFDEWGNSSTNSEGTNSVKGFLFSGNYMQSRFGAVFKCGKTRTGIPYEGISVKDNTHTGGVQLVLIDTNPTDIEYDPTKFDGVEFHEIEVVGNTFDMKQSPSDTNDVTSQFAIEFNGAGGSTTAKRKSVTSYLSYVNIRNNDFTIRPSNAGAFIPRGGIAVYCFNRMSSIDCSGNIFQMGGATFGTTRNSPAVFISHGNDFQTTDAQITQDLDVVKDLTISNNQINRAMVNNWTNVNSNFSHTSSRENGIIQVELANYHTTTISSNQGYCHGIRIFGNSFNKCVGSQASNFEFPISHAIIATKNAQIVPDSSDRFPLGVIGLSIDENTVSDTILGSAFTVDMRGCSRFFADISVSRNKVFRSPFESTTVQTGYKYIQPSRGVFVMGPDQTNITVGTFNNISIDENTLNVGGVFTFQKTVGIDLRLDCPTTETAEDEQNSDFWKVHNITVDRNQLLFSVLNAADQGMAIMLNCHVINFSCSGNKVAADRQQFAAGDSPIYPANGIKIYHTLKMGMPFYSNEVAQYTGTNFSAVTDKVFVAGRDATTTAKTDMQVFANTALLVKNVELAKWENFMVDNNNISANSRYSQSISDFAYPSGPGTADLWIGAVSYSGRASTFDRRCVIMPIHGLSVSNNTLRGWNLSSEAGQFAGMVIDTLPVYGRWSIYDPNPAEPTVAGDYASVKFTMKDWSIQSNSSSGYAVVYRSSGTAPSTQYGFDWYYNVFITNMKHKDNVGMCTGNSCDNQSVSKTQSYGTIGLFWMLLGASGTIFNQNNSTAVVVKL